MTEPHRPTRDEAKQERDSKRRKKESAREKAKQDRDSKREKKLAKQDRESKRKKKVAVRFGDSDFNVQDLGFMEEAERASFQEVVTACCFHDLEEWICIVGGLILLMGCLYFFLFGLALLGDSAQVLAGCRAGTLFNNESNPLSSLMTGILATVLMQSSSTTTGVIVSLVEAKVLNIEHAIYLVMGANIGTTVTSTIVSLAHIRNSEQFERAFSAATVHDMFNFMTVAVLFPLEIATGYLQAVTAALVDGAETSRSDPWEGPVKKYVSPLSKLVIISNKKLVEGVANGAECSDFYPIQCDEGLAPSYDTCKTGLVACNKENNECPAFFRESASKGQDQVSGAVCFFIAFFIIFFCIVCMMWVIQKLLFGLTTKVVYTATHCNGYLGIVFGTGITLITQSSSITTSVLIPFAGAGALRLQQLYPIVLGANMGTAVQSVIGAMDKAGTAPLQVALAHLFFNLTGVLIWYPLPWLREVPMYAAKRLGRGAAIWRFFPVFYIALAFLLGPLSLEILSALFEGTTGAVIGASLITVAVAAGLIGLIWWCYFAGGDQKYVDFISKHTTQRDDSAEVAPVPTTITDEEENAMPSTQRSPSTRSDVGGNSNDTATASTPDEENPDVDVDVDVDGNSSLGDNQDEDNISIESRE